MKLKVEEMAHLPYDVKIEVLRKLTHELSACISRCLISIFYGVHYIPSHIPSLPVYLRRDISSVF